MALHQMFKAPAAANITGTRAEMCLKYSAQKKVH